jgi:hypothetical protein
MGLFRRGALSARVEADFKRLITDGDHQLRNNFFNLNFSFDGSRVVRSSLNFCSAAVF